MASILLPIPFIDFDPTEVAVPWSMLVKAGHSVRFATPDGTMGSADPIMLTGNGLGPWKPILAAARSVLPIYEEMTRYPYFQKPLTYEEAKTEAFDAILLAGGHAHGVRPYLESNDLQTILAKHDAAGRWIAAICHGVLLMGRACDGTGKSLLHGRKTTALLRSQEMLAWNMTRLWMGTYYRTYPQTTVEDEVRSYLAAEEDFEHGPMPLQRDAPDLLERGFVVKDRNYISARWPGDAHRFAQTLIDALASS